MTSNNGEQKTSSGFDFESMMRTMMTELDRQAQETSHRKNDGAKEKSQLSEEKSLSAEKEQGILLARAEALARITQEASGEMTQLVVFSLATETYGIATHLVREVQPLRDVSIVPCTPSFVIGVINIRGAIYSVVDIRDFLGVPSQEITDSTKVILVSAANLEVGILADDVLGEISVPLSGIKPPLATRGGIKEEYIEGVTKDMLSILNLEELMRDERFIIHEEVG
ncbi:MAG: purine-binding chemotaxis protein CheW [Anaerolineales bacterium]|nr:purine-binding chemotaxis protein CheW [Anaerolineales bacterium]